MVFRIFLALAILTMLAGCGSDSPEPTPPPVVPAGPLKGEAELQGLWRSKCTPGKLNGLIAKVGIGITQITEIEINEDGISERALLTSDSCDGADIEITSSGTYTSKKGRRDDVKLIDMSLGRYRVKALTEFGMRVLNISKFCGIEKWKIGMARTISVNAPREGCLPEPKLQTVYAIEDDRLYFGNHREAADSGSRPTGLRRDWYFSR